METLDYRGHTIVAFRTDDDINSDIGDFWCGVVEWDLAVGCSLSSRSHAELFAKQAVDAVLDMNSNPSDALTLSGASAVPLELPEHTVDDVLPTIGIRPF